MDQAPAIRFLDNSTPPHITTLILLAGMSAMMMNIFLPALPEMADHFETSYAVMQLSVPLYLMFSAVVQLFVGPISDNLGRRVVMQWALALFLVATLGCLLAPNATVFLIFRIGQAVAATAMVLSRAVIRDMYSEAQSASMLGYVTTGMAVMPMLSPAVGGTLAQLFGWKATIWAMFVVGLGTLLLVNRDLGETARASQKSILGQFREYPELLTSRRFWGYALSSAFCTGTFFAYLGGVPFVGSEIFGMDPFWLGLVIGIPALGYMAGNFFTGMYAARIGINRMVLAGCVTAALASAASLTIFALGLGTPVTFFGMMIFIGLGNGFCIPNATAGLLAVRPHLAGTASGLGGAIMIGGGAALSTLVGMLLTPETGVYPLLWLMLLTAAAGVVSILLVIRRERILGLS